MPRAKSTATERIELRTTPDAKALLLRAAAYEALDLKSYIMSVVIPAARETVQRQERVVLSERDFAHVLDLLENPPPPTPALIEAARRYLRNTGQI
ncbi:MAG: DUF1778 domain-containing protein [Dehalococcoidia bacterium]|nr:DUF1778 domain-containing protein [Dehalococcoidia bacterium]